MLNKRHRKQNYGHNHNEGTAEPEKLKMRRIGAAQQEMKHVLIFLLLLQNTAIRYIPLGKMFQDKMLAKSLWVLG